MSILCQKGISFEHGFDPLTSPLWTMLKNLHDWRLEFRDIPKQSKQWNQCLQTVEAMQTVQTLYGRCYPALWWYFYHYLQYCCCFLCFVKTSYRVPFPCKKWLTLIWLIRLGYGSGQKTFLGNFPSPMDPPSPSTHIGTFLSLFRQKKSGSSGRKKTHFGMLRKPGPPPYLRRFPKQFRFFLAAFLIAEHRLN